MPHDEETDLANRSAAKAAVRAVTALSFFDETFIFALCSDRKLRLWSLARRELLTTLPLGDLEEDVGEGSLGDFLLQCSVQESSSTSYGSAVDVVLAAGVSSTAISRVYLFFGRLSQAELRISSSLLLCDTSHRISSISLSLGTLWALTHSPAPPSDGSREEEITYGLQRFDIPSVGQRDFGGLDEAAAWKQVFLPEPTAQPLSLLADPYQPSVWLLYEVTFARSRTHTRSSPLLVHSPLHPAHGLSPLPAFTHFPVAVFYLSPVIPRVHDRRF